MKSLIIVILFHFMVIQCYSQFSPPEIKFIGIEPNWKYISYDSNFVYQGTPNASPYWGRFTIHLLPHEDGVLILETCLGQNRNVWVGSLTHKICRLTGEMKWIDHNNIYSGIEHDEEYSAGYLLIDEDGNVEFSGQRNYDTFTPGKPANLFYGRPIVRNIDFETGELLKVRYGKDTIKNDAAINNYGYVTIKNSRGDRLRIGSKPVFPENILHESVDFHLIDDGMNIVYPPIDSFLHNSELPTQTPYLSFYPKILPINRDTVVVMIGNKNPADWSQSPSKLVLYWVDIGDIDDIKILKTVDMLDDLYFPQDNDKIYTRRIDENLLFMQLMNTSEPDAPAKKFVWMSWYDKHGNRKAKIDNLEIDGHFYVSAIAELGVIDGSMYIIARKQTDETFDNDVIRIDPGLNQITKVGMLQIPRMVGVNPNFLKGRVLPDNNVLIYLKVDATISGIVTSFNYYYSFSFESLGIKTGVKEIEKYPVNILIHPNPATHSITVGHGYEGEARIEVLDVMGRVLIGKNVMSAGEDELDVSVLNVGVYVVRVLDRRGVVVGRGKFLKR